jgi:hypothetical protein
MRILIIYLEIMLSAKGQFGIYMAGASTETGNMAVLNQVSTCSNAGIEADNEAGCLIDSNTISGVTSTSGYTSGVIFRGTTTASTIRGNSISSITNSAASNTSAGIFLISTTSSTGMLISNNMIWNITAGGDAGTRAYNGHGITVWSGGGYSIVNNTVYMSGAQTSAAYSAALCIYDGATPVPTGLTVQNNIFVNAETTGTAYAIISYPANTAYTAIDYNDYYSAGATTNYVGTYLVSGTSNAQTTLAGWATSTGKDARSANIQPNFVSTTDLDLNNYNNFCLASRHDAG